MLPRSWIFTCILLLAMSCGAGAERLTPAEVPAPLAPWVSWVLDEVPDYDCPYLFNSDQRRCIWSGPLRLAIDAHGGEFEVAISAYARSWAALPGGAGQWPQAVAVDGSPAVVTAHLGRPAVELPTGRHIVAGRFEWPKLPEILNVPSDLGVVRLNVAGRPEARIIAARGGQLWLQPPASPGAEGDRVELKVYRQLQDELPMTVVTVLELDVAGAQREWSSSGVLLDGAVPMQLSSPLPARLEADGRLRLQLRPGHWRVELTSRQADVVSRLAPPDAAAPWPPEEVWSFAARNALRVVEISGGNVIDPRQSNAPPEWAGLPTWRMTGGDALSFVEQRRGDPDPEPDQLTLQRDLWLDFDGGGFTVQDRLSGQITRLWRLDAMPALQLGRVSLNGEPQFITQSGADTRGVEVRHGALDLSADARLARGTLPAIGWALDVKQLSARLHLPPGWRLWSARGVDNVPDTWLKRWTLLDLFLVLIVTIAIARLFARRWAALALLTLALIWHEPEAPRQIWLHLLVAQALLGVLPHNRLRRLIVGYRNLALATMAVLCIGFMIAQVRLGLFPQLAQPYQQIGATESSVASVAPQPMAPAQALQDEISTAGTVDNIESLALKAEGRARAKMSDAPGGLRALHSSSSAQRDIDPHATIQTGPGLPAWDWITVTLDWAGPVTRDQTLDLYLLSPRVNLVLAVLRVALLAALMILFLGGTVSGVGEWLARQRAATALALLGLVVGATLPQSASAALPDKEVLQELKARLTRAPECLPSCASVPRLRAELHGEVLTLALEVHAARAVAVPLPGGAEQWVPALVQVDGSDERGLFRDESGVLWVELAEGRHRLDLHGTAPDGASFQLPFPLAPEHLEVALDGWSVSGQRPDGGSEPQLIFTRIATSEAGDEHTLEPRALPGFFRVERVLRLGLDWRVETQVTRLTPTDSAAALAIPLLAGESVTTPEVRVVDGRVQVNLAANQSEMHWVSVLAQASPITLTAPDSRDWVETWRADIASVWHAELGGLAVVHHQDEQGQWLPTWQPWPGERVSLTLTRPRGVAGQSLTIDMSHLEVRPAQRASDFMLSFSLRSSQGGQHSITLPAGATLDTIALNDVPQPLRQEGRKLSLPVVPGVQRYRLNWHDDEGLRAFYRLPAWSLGVESVNAGLSLALPADRWVLFAGGPRLGPAVLFWGVLLVWCLVAVGLGRSRITPLSTLQWLLLVIGLTQIAIPLALIVIAWPFALALRARVPDSVSRFTFNALQVALALLTLGALGLLFGAIQQGLLGQPDMQIAGNGSSALQLSWFQDRVATDYPSAWVLSVSLWFYRGLMLAWALWLAFALLEWLRWGWQCFSTGGVWRASPPRVEAAAPAAEQNVFPVAPD